MSRRRVEALSGIPVLRVDDPVRLLAKELVQERLLPPAVISDALHAAVATLHMVDYLLTWNCRQPRQPAFAERVADIHGRMRDGVAANLHTD